jgi:hypothetical protein
VLDAMAPSPLLHPKSGLFDFLNFHADHLAGIEQHQSR